MIGKTLLASAVVLAVAGSVSAETLNVGSTPTGVPFTFLDIESNAIEGMMVDLIVAVGEEAGFEVNVQPLDFASLVPALTSNRIDIISAAMLATEARREVIDFSNPIIPYGEGIAVGPDGPATISADFNELAGETIGVQQGTVYLDNLQGSDVFGEVRVYDSLANILSEVNRGRIAAGVGDRPIIAYQLSEDRYPDTTLAEYESQYVGEIAFGVRKDSPELLERLNAALEVVRERGVIDELAAKWGVQ